MGTVQINNVSYRSDQGYTLSLYAHDAIFERERDHKILILSSYSLPNSVFVVQWPGIVKWDDDVEVSEEEVRILMQIVTDVDSLAEGWSISNTRRPIPGR